MTKIIIEILLDPAQTTPLERKLLANDAHFRAEEAVAQFTVGRWGRRHIDYECDSRVEEDE